MRCTVRLEDSQRADMFLQSSPHAYTYGRRLEAENCFSKLPWYQHRIESSSAAMAT